MSHTEIVNYLFLVVFSIELLSIGILLGRRSWQYWKAHWAQPFLMRREILLFISLAWVIFWITIRRVLDLEITGSIEWILFTSTPPALALGWWIRDELKLG